MVKTVSRGVRLPADLWDLIKACNPNQTYSSIIERALLRVYDFDDSDDIGDGIPDGAPAPAAAAIDRIHDEIDTWKGYV